MKTDAEKLLFLADWFDAIQKRQSPPFAWSESTVVQDDLRRMADKLKRPVFDCEVELNLSLEEVQKQCTTEDPETFWENLVADWLAMHREITIRDGERNV